MDKDAARHAVSMDQVLMSAKKPFAGLESAKAAKLEWRTDDHPILPESVRRQQRRLATLQSRRTKLPPLPTILRNREAPADLVQPPLRTEVPQAVEINAVQEAPDMQEPTVEPAFKWSKRSKTSEHTQPSSAARNASAIETELLLDRSMLEHAQAGQVADADWESLKSGLRSVVDAWVERQRLSRSAR